MCSGRLAMRAVVATTLLVLVTTTGCSSDADPEAVDEREFESVMQDRFGATDDQARCITGYVFDRYDQDDIDVIVDEGMAALAQARWEPYLNASIACLTHDQPLATDP